MIRSVSLALLLAGALLACGDRSANHVTAIVVSEERVFIDRSRATPPNGGFSGAPERRLATRLWFLDRVPTSARACGSRACALVLLAHGFGGNTGRFDAIGRAIASAGYMVAAPAFPLTNDRAPGGHLNGLGDLVQQPADLSFTIDELLAVNDAPADDLAGRIDGARIGVVGHSLGGITVIALSRLSCCTDARIRAVVGVAPAVFVASLFEEQIPAAGPPTLVVSGTEDANVPHALVREFYDSILAPRAFLGVAGAHHSDLIENNPDPGPFLDPTTRATIAFFDEVLSGAHGATSEALEALRKEGQSIEIDLGA